MTTKNVMTSLKDKFAKAVLDDNDKLTNKAFFTTIAAGIVPAFVAMSMMPVGPAALGVFAIGFYAGTGAAAVLTQGQSKIAKWKNTPESTKA